MVQELTWKQFYINEQQLIISYFTERMISKEKAKPTSTKKGTSCCCILFVLFPLILTERGSTVSYSGCFEIDNIFHTG